MQFDSYADITHQAIKVALMISAPMLIGALIMGILVSLFHQSISARSVAKILENGSIVSTGLRQLYFFLRLCFQDFSSGWIH